MRVALVITGFGLGGAEVQVAELAANLAKRRVQVCVIVLTGDAGTHPLLQDAGVPIIPLGMRRGRADVRGALSYVRTLRAFKPDVVHAHLFHANVLARLGRVSNRAPVVCTVHSLREAPVRAGGLVGVRVRAREWAYRLTDPLCAITTHVSALGAARYARVRAVPVSKLCVIPNGVNHARFERDEARRAQVRRAWGLENRFIWAWVGRIEAAKEPIHLVESFARCRSPRASTLLIAGSGSLELATRQRVTELQMGDRVRFLGVSSDVPSLMNAADAFVLSSSREGLPMVLLEAASAGLPLVVTDAGGNREVVAEGAGVVVPVGEADALARSMDAVMDLEPVMLAEMGNRARRHVVATYGIETVVDRWMGLYCSLTGARS